MADIYVYHIADMTYAQADEVVKILRSTNSFDERQSWYTIIATDTKNLSKILEMFPEWKVQYELIDGDETRLTFMTIKDGQP